ncbi:MAG: SLC13 family permease [Brumimicrobium sp.]|nr:SLC13 family permease [Brumimicrobium sp.]
MTLSIGLVLGVLVIAFVFFLTGWLRPDIIAMLVLLSLVIMGIIEPIDAFQGFSSFAVMAIAGLLIIGEGLERTGVVKWVARKLEGLTGKSFNRLLLINTSIPGLLSGFVNIVAAASFFIPVILRLCLKLKVSPSKVLMPMACLALCGANLTLIGASHNLVVHSLLEESQGAGFGFFEFTIVGAALLIVALLYIFVLGRKLLPERVKIEKPKEVTVTSNLIENYDLKDSLYEVWITTEYKNTAVKLSELDLEKKYGLLLIEVVREHDQFLNLEGDFELKREDLLLIKGEREVVKKFCDSYEGIAFMGPPRSQEKYPVSSAELAEAVVPPRSPVVGKTAKEMNFKKEFGLTLIGYYRNGKAYHASVSEEKLEEGDGLLFYGPRDKIRDFEPEKEILVYHKPGEPDVSSSLKKKAPLAALILVAVIGSAAANLVPISVSALAGAVLMVLTGIINPLKTYDAIDWKTLVLIGGMYPLGLALSETGASDLIGNTLIDTLGGFGPIVVMAGIVILTMILTQPIHNAAVAIIMTPIAINAAELMGTNPRAFCVAVLVACSTTFLMPFGHPAPLMVQEPGKYKGSDYIKFGLPLNILALAVILITVPLVWKL